MLRVSSSQLVLCVDRSQSALLGHNESLVLAGHWGDCYVLTLLCLSNTGQVTFLGPSKFQPVVDSLGLCQKNASKELIDAYISIQI